MALGPYIVSKDELKVYILEKLGSPVINIEVTDTQIQHAINETLEKWVERGEGGIQYRFFELETTAGNATYQLNYDVEAVAWIYDLNNIDLGAVFPAGQWTTTSFHGGTSTTATSVTGSFPHHDLLSIELTRNYLATIEHLLSEKVEFDFNSSTKELYLIDPFDIDRTVGITYYQRVDYSKENSFLYDHSWIKRYATSLTKRQWASNLLKYTGTSLPAGLQLNAELILTEANTEIEKLEDELFTTWSLPPDFFVG